MSTTELDQLRKDITCSVDILKRTATGAEVQLLALQQLRDVKEHIDDHRTTEIALTSPMTNEPLLGSRVVMQLFYRGLCDEIRSIECDLRGYLAKFPIPPEDDSVRY